MTTTAHPELDGIGTYEFGWSDSDKAGANARRGINEEVVRDISAKKSEPEWMLEMRLKGLRLFEKKPMPTWGSDLTGIFFDTIKYFVRSTEKQATTWEELPEEIKTLTTDSEFQKLRRSVWFLEWLLNTSPRLSTTRLEKILKSRA